MSECPLDSQEFHELCMAYRAATGTSASRTSPRACFRRLQDFVRSKFIDIHKSAPDAPRVTVFDFMTRGQSKEFHEVFGRYIDWQAAQGQIEPTMLRVSRKEFDGLRADIVGNPVYFCVWPEKSS